MWITNTGLREGDITKTVLIVIGIVVMLLVAMLDYACVIIGKEAEHDREEWERDRH